MTQPNKKSLTKNALSLSIQCCLSGLSFSVLDTNSNTITYLKEFTKNKNLSPLELLDYLKFILDTETALNTPFKTVTVVYKNELATPVPMSLFNSNALADYLKFNNKILPTDFIAFDEILTHNIAVVYVPLVNINNFIYDTFGEFTYKHFATLYIDYALKNTLTSTTTMFANVFNNSLEIIVVEKNNLLLYNSFNYTTKEDFIYYILFTAEQLNLNTEEFILTFTGNISKENNTYAIAYKYVKNIILATPSFPFTFSENIKATSTHLALINNFI